jgi:hypothetical protein
MLGNERDRESRGERAAVHDELWLRLRRGGWHPPPFPVVRAQQQGREGRAEQGEMGRGSRGREGAELSLATAAASTTALGSGNAPTRRLAGRAPCFFVVPSRARQCGCARRVAVRRPWFRPSRSAQWSGRASPSSAARPTHLRAGRGRARPGRRYGPVAPGRAVLLRLASQ